MTARASSRAEIVELASARAPAPLARGGILRGRQSLQQVRHVPVDVSPQESARQLSLEEFTRLVDQLPDLRRAVLQGIGEPLLNRDLAAMIGYLKQRDVYVVFNTNAALLTRRRQVELIESQLDELRVSIDGSTPETYAKVRGIPTFERVIDNVAEMVRTVLLAVDRPKLSFWAARPAREPARAWRHRSCGEHRHLEEVYLQRMVFGFGADGLARPEQSIYVDYRAQAEAIIADAERRAARHGISFRGADALSHARASSSDPSRPSHGARAVAHCVWRT